MDSKEHIYYNALNVITRTNYELLSFFQQAYGSFAVAWEGLLVDGMSNAVGGRASERILQERKSCDPEKLWTNMVDGGVRLVLCSDELYPVLLREMADPPWGLYIRGELQIDSNINIGIVGTRRAEEYGKRVAGFFVRELARYKGVVIVSGLALGIDASAHRASVDSGVPTYAVLGTGVDVVYPRHNLNLAEDILRAGGALISEYPCGTGPQRHHFPQRNRIVSGLSRGVVVVEAPARSGSLITARLALDYNRDVFVVPGSIFSDNMEGSFALLRDGARPVVSAEDIATEYGLQKIHTGEKSDIAFESLEQEKIFNMIKTSQDPLFPDEIVRATTFDVATIQRELSLLLLDGIIRELGGKYYAE